MQTAAHKTRTRTRRDRSARGERARKWPEPPPMVTVAEGGEIRCPFCNALMAKARLGPGSVFETKCRRARCRKIFTVMRM